MGSRTPHFRKSTVDRTAVPTEAYRPIFCTYTLAGVINGPQHLSLCALGAAWSVETGIHGQLELEYSVGQLELCHTIVDVKMK
jgi:hypothetical protein